MIDSERLNHSLINRFESSLSAARRGERSELGCLLNFYREYLVTFATRKLSRDLALKSSPSDLVQSTLLKASNEFVRFRGVTEWELRTWLKKILTRKLVDTDRFYRRSIKRDISREVPLRAETLPNNLNSESGSPALVEKMEILSILLNRLDEVDREVIQLRTFERASFEQIGVRMGRSAEAVRKLWTRAILRLTKEFRAHESRTRSGT